MAETTIYNNGETLINRGLSMRTINNELTQLFQRYSMTLNRILGDELMGNSQMRQIYSDQNGVFEEYSKGQMKIKNGIDNLRYLLEHRQTISKLIGVDSKVIGQNKRNLADVKDYLSRLKSNFELGDSQDSIQLYISKHDNNIGGLDQSSDWVDYILTQRWIDKLCTRANGGQYSPSDYRIDYLSVLIEGLLSDHILDYHKKLEEFEPSDFLNKGTITIDSKEVNFPLEDAMNMLNSFGNLNYGFYELFKPIGSGKGKYIKVQVGTDGYVNISGVVALSDCHHWKWEHGSEAYLRSLNTGNQRYLLQLDMPFNDESSVLWWKPDNPEKLNPEPPYDEQGNQKPTVKYYKEYEVERFLRWFGNDHVPRIDEDTIEKCTICSSPALSNDTESDNFHSDARNIGESGMDLTRMNIDDSTSESLLSLYPKSTISVRTYFHDDEDKDNDIYEQPKEDDDPSKIHQYLEFVVTGNRQTNSISFNVQGHIGSEIQEMNHYIHTMDYMRGELEYIFNYGLFFSSTETIFPELAKVWYNLKSDINFNEDWNPPNWNYLETKLKSLVDSPTQIDLLRFRQLDIETIHTNDELQQQARMSFIVAMSNSTYESDEDANKKKKQYIFANCVGSDSEKEELFNLVINKNFLIQPLLDYITNFKKNTQEALERYYQGITQITNSQKDNLLRNSLVKMYGKRLKNDESPEEKQNLFKDVTPDVLRDRITTFNNLIVRLPVSSRHNCLASKHIFQDWKAFVDGATEYLITQGELSYGAEVTELGTDEKEHTYKELLYTEDGKTKPLVDYSYITRDDDGIPSADRWDYWTEEDFKWPQ